MRLAVLRKIEKLCIDEDLDAVIVNKPKLRESRGVIIFFTDKSKKR